MNETRDERSFSRENIRAKIRYLKPNTTISV